MHRQEMFRSIPKQSHKYQVRERMADVKFGACSMCNQNSVRMLFVNKDSSQYDLKVTRPRKVETTNLA